MANIIFNLRTMKGTDPQMIYLVYWFGDKDRLTYSTGLKVEPKFWNPSQYRVRNVVECLSKDTINNYLNRIQADTEAHITELKASMKPVTKEALKQYLNNYTNPIATSGNALADFVTEFVSNGTSKINPSTGRFVTLRTVQAYKKFAEYLKGFEAKTKRRIDFADVDLDFYEDFTGYLRDVGLATNTIGKYIRILKAILNEAAEKGVNKHSAYKSHRFKVVQEESENIYLSESELTQLYDFDFSKHPRLERARDLFLVGCWTGLRFSDFTRITSKDIQGGFINIEQQKTGKRVLIPLHPVVSEIWEKYGEHLPPNISNQKLNDYIKEVCKMAELNSPEHKAITKGGVKRSTQFEKWELVSTHTARRSFATNLFKSGFPAISIMQITGHKTEKAFLKYIKVTPEEHANLLRMHWIKQGSHLRAI